MAYLLDRLTHELETHNPVDLSLVKKVWKLAQTGGLSRELLDYYLGQGKDLFVDELWQLASCYLETFLKKWPLIRRILERELEKNRIFQQRNRGVNLPCLEEFPEWFRGKMDSFRADPVVDPARPETILLHVAWLLEQPGRREETKTKWRATVFKMIFEQPYLYHYLRSRLDLDWLCNLDGPKRSHLEKGYWRQFEEAAQQQALQQQQARDERGEEGLGADTSTGDQVDAEHPPKRRNDEPASPWDRGLDLDAIFELCATPGQVALIGGITGRGKTVFASQLALQLVRQGRRVAMVLTEIEGPEAIAWRFLSSTFNLTPGEIRESSWKTDGAFPEEWRSRPGWAELDRALKNCLRFLDWTTGDQDISQNLDPELGKLAASGFDPQIVIIDGLINGVKSPEPLRFTMLRAAEVIKTHAQVHQRAMIVTSQIDTVGSKNHIEMLPAMLSECPGIADHADTWVGISDIENADPALGMVPSIQYLTVQSKDRQREVVVVVRNFKYQRFEANNSDWVRILNKWG